jgi:hypothetical protein
MFEEIPIEAEDQPENVQDIPEHIPENMEVIKPVAKKRGRPAGAKNKAKPPAPKPKPKPKAKEIEYEYEEESEEEEMPPPRRRTRPEPVEVDRHALAADVLNLLQEQRYERTNARRNHYASWFENMGR